MGLLDPPALTTAAAAATYATRQAGLRPTLRTPRAPAYTYVTTFQAGHGFTASGAGSVNLNDTANYVLGGQGITIVADSSGGGVLLFKSGFTAADLSARQFAVLARVSDMTALSSLSLQLGTSSFTNYANINVAVGANPGTTTSGLNARSGEWAWFHCTWADLSNTVGTLDRTLVTDFRLRVASRGTTAVTVNIAAIAHWPKPTAYPNGVVTISLDDNWASHWTIAKPALDKYGYPATIYPVLDQLDVAGRLTTAQVQQLVRLNRWDIGCHAATTANHNVGFSSLDTATVTAEIAACKKWISDNGLGPSDHFAWPAGGDSLATETIIRGYCTHARHVVKDPRPTLPPGVPMRVPVARFGDATTTQVQLTTEVDNAYANGSWAYFAFHDLAASPTLQQTNSVYFTALVDYCATKGIPVQTVSQVLSNL